MPITIFKRTIFRRTLIKFSNIKNNNIRISNIPNKNIQETKIKITMWLPEDSKLLMRHSFNEDNVMIDMMQISGKVTRMRRMRKVNCPTSRDCLHTQINSFLAKLDPRFFLSQSELRAAPPYQNRWICQQSKGAEGKPQT